MSQKPEARRCYYQILEIPFDADEESIKKAYKKQALRWHPDRNIDNTEEATHIFKEIGEAFEILSDKNERAWYDAHREQILKGINPNDLSESSHDIDLIPYCSPYAYSSFDSKDPNNFYNVYNELFKKIIEIEGISKKNTKFR